MSKKASVLVIVIITLFLLLKVGISNSIYLNSRDIQKINTKIDALKEEQNILKLKIEKLKYQNEIQDPIYNFNISNDNEVDNTKLFNSI